MRTEFVVIPFLKRTSRLVPLKEGETILKIRPLNFSTSVYELCLFKDDTKFRRYYSLLSDQESGEINITECTGFRLEIQNIGLKCSAEILIS